MAQPDEQVDLTRWIVAGLSMDTALGTESWIAQLYSSREVTSMEAEFVYDYHPLSIINYCFQSSHQDGASDTE